MSTKNLDLEEIDRKQVNHITDIEVDLFNWQEVAENDSNKTNMHRQAESRQHPTTLNVLNYNIINHFCSFCYFDVHA